MTNSLIVAGAGAGKSTTIVENAVSPCEDQRKVLLLTYTEGNQAELLSKICAKTPAIPSNVRVKGWFTFLLEELIRPYQNCIAEKRVDNILFDESDPHWQGKYMIRGRAEKPNGATINPRHFLTKSLTRAHTTYISKFAYRIIEMTNGAPIDRLAEIYRLVLIDEIQDLAGWDYEVLKAIAAQAGIELVCVGDFRQTLYSTTPRSQKKPSSSDEKLGFFKSEQFDIRYLNLNYRSVQPICEFANTIHAHADGFQPSQSAIDQVPVEFAHHVGVFAVRSSDVRDYVDCYSPTILRLNRSTEVDLCSGRQAFNFGESKGAGFDRVLVITTKKQRDFISGKSTVFDADKTEKARNAFYVAATRARYSVAFVFDEAAAVPSVVAWCPSPGDA